MLFYRTNKATPERMFIVVYNSYSSATLTNGQAVIWDFNDDVNGVGVTRPTAIATNQGFAAAGITAENIIPGEYGLIQVYGYHPAVRARAGTSAIVIDKGTPLALNAAGSVFCVEAFVSSTVTGRFNRYPCALALEAYTLWTTTAIKAFVKCL